MTPDGSTGDELDSDGDVAMATTGHVRKKTTKKSRTRSVYCVLFFVQHINNLTHMLSLSLCCSLFCITLIL